MLQSWSFTSLLKPNTILLVTLFRGWDVAQWDVIFRVVDVYITFGLCFQKKLLHTGEKILYSMKQFFNCSSSIIFILFYYLVCFRIEWAEGFTDPLYSHSLLGNGGSRKVFFYLILSCLRKGKFLPRKVLRIR